MNGDSVTPPLYHGAEDPFPVRGSFQPIDLNEDSDNEDAESWLVAPTPRAGSVCSQFWAPNGSVYDDDISPTMSARSSLAGDAFPPLANSPDPNMRTPPSTRGGAAGGRTLRNSTSRIPRPSSHTPPSVPRAHDPMRQSMPTYSSQHKYGPRPNITPPYRPSSSTARTPAQRNLAARQSELRASIARQNEVRAGLTRSASMATGSGYAANSSSSAPGSPHSPMTRTGSRLAGANGHTRTLSHSASMSSGSGSGRLQGQPGQTAAQSGSKIGSGLPGGYASKLANAPGVRIPEPRSPTAAAAQQQQQAWPEQSPQPAPSTPPLMMPTPNKLSPQMAAAVGHSPPPAYQLPVDEDEGDEDMHSAHSGEGETQQQRQGKRDARAQGASSIPSAAVTKEGGNPKKVRKEAGPSRGAQARQQQQDDLGFSSLIGQKLESVAEQQQQQAQQMQQQEEELEAEMQQLEGHRRSRPREAEPSSAPLLPGFGPPSKHTSGTKQSLLRTSMSKSPQSSNTPLPHQDSTAASDPKSISHMGTQMDMTSDAELSIAQASTAVQFGDKNYPMSSEYQNVLSSESVHHQGWDPLTPKPKKLAPAAEVGELESAAEQKAAEENDSKVTPEVADTTGSKTKKEKVKMVCCSIM